MNGFKVLFLDENGDKKSTWMGMPITNMDVSALSQNDIAELVCMVFHNAHEGCRVYQMELCDYEDYEAVG